MPKIYSEEDKRQLKIKLLRIGREHLACDGYQNAVVSRIAVQAGISKSLFYKLFPSKEQFVLQALEEQQSALREKLTAALAHTERPVVQRVFAFLVDCTKNAGALAVLTPTEQLLVLEHLNSERSTHFQTGRLSFYRSLLTQIGRPATQCNPQVFGNLFELLLFTRHRPAETMPFLFEHGMDETAQLLAQTTIRYLFGNTEA